MKSTLWLPRSAPPFIQLSWDPHSTDLTPDPDLTRFVYCWLPTGAGILPAGAGIFPTGAGILPTGAGILPRPRFDALQVTRLADRITIQNICIYL